MKWFSLKIREIVFEFLGLFFFRNFVSACLRHHLKLGIFGNSFPILGAGMRWPGFGLIMWKAIKNNPES